MNFWSSLPQTPVISVDTWRIRASFSCKQKRSFSTAGGRIHTAATLQGTSAHLHITAQTLIQALGGGREGFRLFLHVPRQPIVHLVHPRVELFDLPAHRHQQQQHQQQQQQQQQQQHKLN
eukprot:COSAG06_NODE_505_length_14944_cov_17.290901_11_plen_120_part_00